MKLTVVLAVLIGILVLACSSTGPAPAEPTPNIDATVEARVAQERAVDATVEARLKEERASQATSIPSPTNTQAPIPTYTPNPTYTPYPTPTNTPTLVPIATSVPTPTPSPIPTAAPTPEPAQTLSAVFVRKWGNEGTGNGQFQDPYGLSVSIDGSVYIAAWGNDRIQKYSSAGVFISKWGNEGTGDGQFDNPFGVTVASDGSVYVADRSNDRIQKFTAEGVFVTKWGTEGGGDGQFDAPYGVAVASDGSVYVADTANHRIQKFTSEGVFISKWGDEGTGDGQFKYPWGIAVSSDGSVYVAEQSNNRIQKFTSAGVFISKWGTAGDNDGEFSYPRGVAVASDGSVYVADTNNNRIQKFTAEGVFVTKWGTEGDGDGQFDAPYGVAVASDGSVYVSEYGNDRIQKFSVGGVGISTPPTPTPSTTPTVVFTPSSGLPGSQIYITGVGFTPNSSIEAGSNDCRVSGITLAGKCEDGSHARTTVSSLGDFILSYTVPMDSVANSSGTLLELKVTDSRGVTTSNAFFNLIVANSTPPTPTPTPTPRPTATPQPSRATYFGDGTWVVGDDIQAGTYRSSETGSGCYWERLSGFSGELDDIIANGVTDAIWVVEIASTDAGFSTERCGTWTEATSAITSSLSSPFGDGTFIVGLDIASGTWRSPGGDSCYWARLSGFSGELGHIKANGVGGSNNILTIEPADKGFESSNCGTWTKTG
jgi:DNA-binding beta-propeller fold protein YncE